MYDKELSYITVGGTDISCIAGTNTYCSAFELLKRKRNKIDVEMNLKMLLGKTLESTVADVYAFNKGVALKGTGEESIVMDTMYRASIDRYIIQDNIARIIDIKTRWAYWKNQMIARYYCDQVNYYTGIYEELGLFDDNFVGDPYIVTLYCGELYEVVIPYSHQYFQEQKQMAKEFYGYMQNNLDLPFELIKKWHTAASFYDKLYEDLRCRKISGLVVEQLTT
jgi:predicted phage-related endonuclease